MARRQDSAAGANARVLAADSLGLIVAEAQSLLAERPVIADTPKRHMTRWLDPIGRRRNDRRQAHARKHDDRDTRMTPRRSSRATRPTRQERSASTTWPTWVTRSILGERTESLIEIDRFVAELITANGATAPLYLAGDSHLFAAYRRLRADGTNELHVSTGGGGAFLQPTHHLATAVPESEIDGDSGSAVDPARFTDGQFWPHFADSRAPAVVCR